MPRSTPFDLVFEQAAQEIFPQIRAAFDQAGHDSRDRDRFLMIREVVTLLRELRPEEGLGEGIDQLAALVHHAYLFWDAGSPTVELTAEILTNLSPRSPEPDLAPPAAYYARVPERRVWAEVIPGSPHEPLDGCFVHFVPGGIELRVLGVFGIHPERGRFQRGRGCRVGAAGARPGRWDRSICSDPAWGRGGATLLSRWRGRAAGAGLAHEDTRRRGLGGGWPMESVKDYMDKKAVAQVLEQIAAFLELKGENPFRIRAFRTAARAITTFPRDLRQSLEDGSLASAKGVGPATLQIVTELVGTGRASMLEELREQIPPGLVEMLEISGLGVAKIRQIHEVLGIDSLPELEAAALDGRLAKLPRFGPRTSENMLKAIAFLRQASSFRLSHHAADEAEGLRAALERLPGVMHAVIAGEVRRRTEVVKDLVIVLVAETSPAELFRKLSQLPGVHEFAGQDERRLTLRFAGGLERPDRRHDTGQRGSGSGAGDRQRGTSPGACRARPDEGVLP